MAARKVGGPASPAGVPLTSAQAERHCADVPPIDGKLAGIEDPPSWNGLFAPAGTRARSSMLLSGEVREKHLEARTCRELVEAARVPSTMNARASSRVHPGERRKLEREPVGDKKEGRGGKESMRAGLLRHGIIDARPCLVDATLTDRGNEYMAAAITR